MMSRLADLPLLQPRSRAEWREWLAANHATSRGTWLAIGKKGARRPALGYEEAVEEALCFGWIDSTAQRLDAERYKQLFTPRKPDSTWSQSNKERVGRLTEQGLMTPAGLAAIERAKANGSWDMLDAVEALVVPDDLSAALALRPGATAAFAAFNESTRKAILYWVMSAKRPETRAKRIEQTALAAAEGKSPLG